MTEPKSDIVVVKEFFGSDRPVANKELLELKHADPAGIKTLAEGIRSGSLTY